MVVVILETEIDWVAVELLPWISVAVQVKIVVAPKGNESGALLVILNIPQLSVAVGLLRLTIEVQDVISWGTIITGGIISKTVIVCTWFAAELLQLSIKLQVLFIIRTIWPVPFEIASVYVACKFEEQLSDSLVTSPVNAILAS